MRSAAAKVLLLTVTLLIGVSMMEWGVRRLFPYFSPTAQVPFRLVAKGMALGPAGQTVRMATPKGDYNSVLRFNQDGFRDMKTLAEAGKADWYALGDSYTMGWGVEEEERFSNRLEPASSTSHCPTTSSDTVGCCVTPKAAAPKSGGWWWGSAWRMICGITATARGPGT